MRDTCLACVSKHLSAAIILVPESILGYELSRWFAVGHLVEAEYESVSEYPDLAQKIRAARVALMGQDGVFHHECLVDLLKETRKICEDINGKTELQSMMEVYFGKQQVDSKTDE